MRATRVLFFMIGVFLFSFFGVGGVAHAGSPVPFLDRLADAVPAVVYDDEEEDDDSSDKVEKEKRGEGERDEDEEDDEEEAVKPKDEFVLEKRSEEIQEYKEPEVVSVKKPTYLYTENSTGARKMFELFRGDDLVVIEEEGDWIKVEFLGKEGWVERDAVAFTKYTVYSLFADLSMGISSSPDLKNFSVLGDYSIALFYGLHEYFMPGIEFKALSVDTDVMYTGGGPVLRGYIPYLESKISKTLISVSGGYFRMPEIPTYKGTGARPDTIIFNGGYLSSALEHVVRVSEPVYIGGGFDFLFAGGSGKTASGETVHRSFWSFGGRIKVLFNIWE